MKRDFIGKAIFLVVFVVILVVSVYGFSGHLMNEKSTEPTESKSTTIAQEKKTEKETTTERSAEKRQKKQCRLTDTEFSVYRLFLVDSKYGKCYYID